jgi:uncharacterized protein
MGAAPDGTEMEVLDYATFGVAMKSLAEMIHSSGFEPEIILAIARGGLFVAGALGYALGVKNLHVMNVEYYTGVDQRLDVPMILPPTPDLVDLSNAKVLIADDVADTGHTLKIVKDFVHGRVGEVRSAVIYEKPRTVVNCEYVWKTTDKWIDFPWSTNAALVTRAAGA